MSDRGRKVALVTGASRGIGATTARWLADAGFDVALAARSAREGDCPDDTLEGRPRPGSLESTAAEVRARGREALEVPLDLSDRASSEAGVPRVLDAWGRIDLLVNNAVVVTPVATAPLIEIQPDALLALLDANLVSQTILAQHALRAMLRQGGGVVVNIVSLAGRLDPHAPMSEGGWAFGYAAHKAALHRLAGIVQVEHGPQGVRAYSIEPGGVPTAAMRAAFTPEQLARMNEAAPFLSEDVTAAVIAWCASDAPASIAAAGQLLDAEEIARKHALLPEESIYAALD